MPDGRPTDALDRQHIDSIRSLPECGEACFSSAVAAFCKQTPQLIALIRHAIAERDEPAFFRATHMLKGSAASIGLPHLARTADSLGKSQLRPDNSSDRELMAALKSMEEEAAIAIELLAEELAQPRRIHG